MKRLFPDCREVTELTSRRQDEPLALLDRLRLQAHLALCEACRRFSQQLDFLRRAARELVKRPRPTPGQEN
jgi:predicted anti-sigma-YlaC factor YlaD